VATRSWAELYAGLEWPCFLMRPGTRRPAAPWQSMATDDLDTLTGWEARNPDANVAIMVPDGWLVVDIDPAADMDAVRATLPHDAPTSRTPRGGYHVWLTVPDGVGELVQRTIAEGVDTKIAGKGWLFEWPSRSPKTGVSGRYRWEVWPDQAGAPEAPQWVLDALAPREQPDAPAIELDPATPDEIARGRHYADAAMADEVRTVAEAREGDRQNALYRAACAVGRFVAGGYIDRDDAIRELVTAARACGLYEDDGAEMIGRQIARGFAEGAREPARVDVPPAVEIPSAPDGDKTRAVNVWPADELHDDDTPREVPLIEPGLLYAGDLAVVAGPPKSQKSLFVMDLALKTARGEAWCEAFRPTRELRWLIVNYEMRRDALRGRLHAFGGGHPGVLITDKGLGPARSELWSSLAGVCEERGHSAPDVVVLDTLAYAYAQDETDNAAMHRWLEATREDVAIQWPDAAIVLVHHSRKATHKELKEDPFSSLRGATSLRGAYDLGVILAKTSEESATRRMWIEARNSPDTPGPLDVRFSAGGFSVVPLGDLPNKTQAEKWDAEAQRRAEAIINLLIIEGAEGNAYTAKTFSERFANRDGLPAARSIRAMLSQMGTRGLVAYSRNVPTGSPLSERSHGHLVCEGWTYGETPIAPTHYRSAEADQVLPLGEPMTWGEL
jgi:hypothetical protein